jgi:hypothetical protein
MREIRYFFMDLFQKQIYKKLDVQEKIFFYGFVSKTNL